MREAKSAPPMWRTTVCQTTNSLGENEWANQAPIQAETPKGETNGRTNGRTKRQAGAEAPKGENQWENQIFISNYSLWLPSGRIIRRPHWRRACRMIGGYPLMFDDWLLTVPHVWLFHWLLSLSIDYWPLTKWLKMFFDTNPLTLSLSIDYWPLTKWLKMTIVKTSQKIEKWL